MTQKKKNYAEEHEEAIKLTEKLVEFELGFFRSIAKTSDYEVIPIPGPYSEEEKNIIKATSSKNNIPVLYRISLGNGTAIVFMPGGDKIGICPDSNPDGFPC